MQQYPTIQPQSKQSLTINRKTYHSLQKVSQLIKQLIVFCHIIILLFCHHHLGVNTHTLRSIRFLMIIAVSPIYTIQTNISSSSCELMYIYDNYHVYVYICLNRHRKNLETPPIKVTKLTDKKKRVIYIIFFFSWRHSQFRLVRSCVLALCQRDIHNIKKPGNAFNRFIAVQSRFKCAAIKIRPQKRRLI